MLKPLFLGSAVGLWTIVGTQAADLPTGKGATLNYVRICDAYGEGFFYISGTDICFKLGGLALFEARVFNTPGDQIATLPATPSPQLMMSSFSTPLLFCADDGEATPARIIKLTKTDAIFHGLFLRGVVVIVSANALECKNPCNRSQGASRRRTRCPAGRSRCPPNSGCRARSPDLLDADGAIG